MFRSIFAICLITAPATVFAEAQPNPWFGTWKLRLKDSSEKPETLIFSDAGNGAMRMVSLEQGSVIVTRFDGEPSPDLGKEGPREPVLAVKATSQTSYTWTFFREGKPYIKGVNSVAADRRTFKEVSWLISKPDKIVTLIYDRQ